MEHIEKRKDLEDDGIRVASRQIILMNTLMVIVIFLKINTWMRLNDQFSKLYTLVIQCVKDIIIFMLYYLYWVIFFASIYIILGADFNVGDKEADYQTMS